MKIITVTVEDHYQAEDLVNWLAHGEDEGELNFSFSVKVEDDNCPEEEEL